MVETAEIYSKERYKILENYLKENFLCDIDDDDDEPTTIKSNLTTEDEIANQVFLSTKLSSSAYTPNQDEWDDFIDIFYQYMYASKYFKNPHFLYKSDKYRDETLYNFIKKEGTNKNRNGEYNAGISETYLYFDLNDKVKNDIPKFLNMLMKYFTFVFEFVEKQLRKYPSFKEYSSVSIDMDSVNFLPYNDVVDCIKGYPSKMAIEELWVCMKSCGSILTLKDVQKYFKNRLGGLSAVVFKSFIKQGISVKVLQKLKVEENKKLSKVIITIPSNESICFDGLDLSVAANDAKFEAAKLCIDGELIIDSIDDYNNISCLMGGYEHNKITINTVLTPNILRHLLVSRFFKVIDISNAELEQEIEIDMNFKYIYNPNVEIIHNDKITLIHSNELEKAL